MEMYWTDPHHKPIDNMGHLPTIYMSGWWAEIEHTFPSDGTLLTVQVSVSQTHYSLVLSVSSVALVLCPYIEQRLYRMVATRMVELQ